MSPAVSSVATMVLLAALALPAWWRESNSHAAAVRGARAYAGQQYEAAAEAFREAHAIDPSARAAFNLGTAEIASGKRTEGSSHLEAALRDPSLRADALFNRANSALAANALDHAVRDYVEALKVNPRHAGAKRNLEIALLRRNSQKRSDAGGGRDQQKDPQKQPTPDAGAKKPQRGELDAETLLRSVQQQEQEELRRMKSRAGEARVGW